MAGTRPSNEDAWRASLTAESRDKIVRRLMDALQRHMPAGDQVGEGELQQIADRFEKKIFQAATDQQDYLRKISLKMLSLETTTNGNPLPSYRSRGLRGTQSPSQRTVQ